MREKKKKQHIVEICTDLKLMQNKENPYTSRAYNNTHCRRRKKRNNNDLGVV